MCFGSASTPPPYLAPQPLRSKDRYRSGSSSGSATDASFPPSPDLRKHDRRPGSSSAYTNELPIGRVALAPSERPGSSSTKSSAPFPPVARKPSRRGEKERHGDDKERHGEDRKERHEDRKERHEDKKERHGDDKRERNSASSSTPRKSPSKRRTVPQSPLVNEHTHKLAHAAPPRTRSRRVSQQSTPQVGYSKDPTPAGSPRKGTSAKGFTPSITSSHGRLSGTTNSPFLRPSGSSQTSSDAGSSRGGSSEGDVRRRTRRLPGAEGVIGLGISTEGSPRKHRKKAAERRDRQSSGSYKATLHIPPPPPSSMPPPVSSMPAPAIMVHAAAPEEPPRPAIRRAEPPPNPPTFSMPPPPFVLPPAPSTTAAPLPTPPAPAPPPPSPPPATAPAPLTPLPLQSLPPAPLPQLLPPALPRTLPPAPLPQIIPPTLPRTLPPAPLPRTIPSTLQLPRTLPTAQIFHRTLPPALPAPTLQPAPLPAPLPPPIFTPPAVLSPPAFVLPPTLPHPTPVLPTPVARPQVAPLKYAALPKRAISPVYVTPAPPVPAVIPRAPVPAVIPRAPVPAVIPKAPVPAVIPKAPVPAVIPKAPATKPSPPPTLPSPSTSPSPPSSISTSPSTSPSPSPPPSPPPKPQLRKRASSASLSSQYSSSSVVSDTTVNSSTAPQFTGGPRNLKTEVPKPPVAAPRQRSISPIPQKLEERYKQLPRAPAKPVAREPVIQPKFIPAPRPERKFTAEPEWREPVHTSAPLLALVPQTPATKYPPTRETHLYPRDSEDTVDYAAFVAESQKKKKQQKMNEEMGSPVIGGKRGGGHLRGRPPQFEAPPAKFASRSMSELREDLAAMVGRKNALARMKMETNAGCESDLSTVGTSVAPQATEPPRRQKSHLPPAHNPVQGLKSNPKPVHKLIQALGKNQEENPDRALQRVQKEEDDDEDEGSSVLSYRMNGAPSEFTAPLPFAPSPPPVTRRSSKKPQHLHHPPLGAADLWYQEVDSGLREVEQDWVNAGELWEEDQRPPEAPSPPLSRVFTPGMERSRGPPGGRMRQEHSYHSTGGYDYNYRPAGY